MKVVIIEDELIAAENLAQMLQESPYPVEVLTVLHSVKSSVSWFRKNSADLVFMDIHLGDGNSFSIFEEVDIKAPVIYITAYDQYALRAFKLNSIDYLLKPLDKQELLGALEKFRNNALSMAGNLKSLIEALALPKQEYQKRFMVSTGNRIRSVLVADIQCFFSEGRYVSILDKEGKISLCDQTLEKLEAALDPDDFFRINRSVIVQFRAISQMVAYSKSRVKIFLKKDPGFELIVSIDRTAAFRGWLNR